jgi:hypothetical protein
MIPPGRPPVLASATGNTSGMPEPHLRVMTVNLLSPSHADWDARRKVLRAGFASWQPDVVALQETVWGQGYDQAADLLGENYTVVRHPRPSDDGVGAALATRWPVRMGVSIRAAGARLGCTLQPFGAPVPDAER